MSVLNILVIAIRIQNIHQSVEGVPRLCPQLSSIVFFDFPWNKPSSYLGTPGRTSSTPPPVARGRGAPHGARRDRAEAVKGRVGGCIILWGHGDMNNYGDLMWYIYIYTWLYVCPNNYGIQLTISRIYSWMALWTNWYRWVLGWIVFEARHITGGPHKTWGSDALSDMGMGQNLSGYTIRIHYPLVI